MCPGSARSEALHRRPLIAQADASLSYYAGFLETLAGLYQRRVRFARADLPRPETSRQGVAVITPDDLRVFIAADDWADNWNADALEWCDAYGTVNRSAGHPAPVHERKVVTLGPNFGWTSTLFGSLSPLRAAIHGGPALTELPARMRAYQRHLRNRVPLGDYPRSLGVPGYVFHVASVWSTHPDANVFRTKVTRILKQVGELTFEGGLVAPGAGAPDEARDLLSRPYPAREYLAKMAISSVAFSAPAVHGCLGWKLGEYFAMGKAIVTAPLGREMPAPLEHGKHVHFIDGSEESILDSVHAIAFDEKRIRALEEGSREYWVRNLEPRAQLTRLLDHARLVRAQGIT